jgi:alpha-galactosidase
MRRLLLSSVLAGLWALVLPSGSCRADEVFTHGQWKVTYVSETGTIKLNRFDAAAAAYRPVIISSVPEASYRLGATGADRTVAATDFAVVETATVPTADAFGSGTRFSIIFRQPSGGDDVTLTQHFCFFDSHPWLLTSLELSSADTLRSNYLAPVSTRQTYALFAASSSNRMLRVPFDNDNFVRYGRYPLSTSITSYEVTALYEGEGRGGVVIGSVDHDHWKSAIRIDAEGGSRIKALRVFSGVADKMTWDVLPHGHLVGDTIRSARFFVGYDADWRQGMTAFTDACNLVTPRRNDWPFGTPVGWMSWNVMETKNNFTDDREIIDYVTGVLRPLGFHNRQSAPNIISIDAWSNLNSSQERQLCAEAASLGAVVGCYGSPFSLWWNEKDLDNIYYQSSLSTYTARDVVLTAHGQPLKFEGAYCLDPTHPAVKASMAKWIRQQEQQGFRYIKLDFMTCGIIQADHYYNPTVHTAVEAYNEGFAYFCKKVGEVKTPIFIVNSISPLFPYQYANARRVACDTWGSINWTEYSMNALTAGWWTDGLYQFNDPDGVPLLGSGDQNALTLSENRARLTGAAITGMVLLADNFSKSNVSGRGNPTVSRKRAESLLANADFCALLGSGRSFMPVYGYGEHGGQPESAENFAMRRDGDTLYVAVINYDSASPLKGQLPFALLGIGAEDCHAVRELWFGQPVTPTGTGANAALPYDVPAKDARIYRLTLRPTGIHALTPTPSPLNPNPSPQTQILAPSGIALTPNPSPQASIILHTTHYADGTSATVKQFHR